jgi:hypothetical protein
MPTMVISLKIGDYAVWRPIFDAQESRRVEAGITGGRVYRAVENPNDLIVLFSVNDMAKARAWISSAHLKSVMAKAGVIGTPTAHFIG